MFDSRLPLVVVLALTGCREPSPAPVAPSHATPDATESVETADAVEQASDDEAIAERFAAFEANMLAGEHRLRFQIAATGAVEATFAGQLVVTAAGLDISASGTFAGSPAKLQLHADDDGISGGHVRGGAVFELPPSEQLRPAVLLGATRMGLLHNLARLLGGRPPEGMDGELDDFVRVESLARGSTSPQEQVGSGGEPLSYALVVKGESAGTGTVWVSEQSPWMVEHHVVVKPMDDQEMHVVERYSPL